MFPLAMMTKEKDRKLQTCSLKIVVIHCYIRDCTHFSLAILNYIFFIFMYKNNKNSV